jgi:hypothetical protein
MFDTIGAMEGGITVLGYDSSAVVREEAPDIRRALD